MDDVQEKLTKELAMSHAIIGLSKEVVPRFRVMVPDGERLIFNQLPDVITARHERMALVRRWMVWQLATGFIFSSETVEPEALFSMAIWRNSQGQVEAKGVYQAKVSKTEYADATAIGMPEAGELLDLLPKRNERLTTAEIAELETLMGEGGIP